LADGGDLPFREGGWRDQHRKVGLAARRGERSRQVDLLAPGSLHAENQHVLREPALVARHYRGDAKREALLAEERVAAVTRAERPDLACFREVDDPLLLLAARPGHILLSGRKRCADRVHARHELSILAEPLRDRAT